VRVLRDGGARILSEGLPFRWANARSQKYKSSVELSIGERLNNPKAHNIYDPASVAFEPSGEKGGTLDILGF
jgi:hypothetical protein